MDICGTEIQVVYKNITEFANTDWKNASLVDWIHFAEANQGFEPGISFDEVRALHEACETLEPRALRIVETGMCHGTSTRYFLVRVLKYGGELHSFEVHVRKEFQDALEGLGLWKSIHLHGHSMRDPWQGSINVLFIDSEHALEDALGEYMRFRVWLEANAIIGFHDSDSCPGVVKAIEMIQEVDKLELISESTGQMGRGVKMFKRLQASRSDRPWNSR